MQENLESNLQLNLRKESDLEHYRVNTLYSKEPETISWIDSWTDLNSSHFFDIGANIGIYSFYAAARHKNLTVFSFEPESKNYCALIFNLLQNPDLSIVPLRFALSNLTEISDIAINDSRVGNSNSQLNVKDLNSDLKFMTIRTDKVLRTKIDFLIESMKFPIPKFIKLDVDGHESQILEGALQTLKNEKLVSILVEFNQETTLDYWSIKLAKLGLVIDESFDRVPGHSSHRRKANQNLARNYIFTRK
jgi:FkbM family methyltransferase